MSWLGEQKISPYLERELLGGCCQEKCKICAQPIKPNIPFILCNQGDVICNIIDGCAAGLEITNKFYFRDGNGEIVMSYNENDESTGLMNIVIKGEDCPCCIPNLMPEALEKVFNDSTDVFQKLLCDRIRDQVYHYDRKRKLESKRWDAENEFEMAVGLNRSELTKIGKQRNELKTKTDEDAVKQREALSAKLIELDAQKDELSKKRTKMEMMEKDRKRKVEYVSPVARKK